MNLPRPPSACSMPTTMVTVHLSRVTAIVTAAVTAAVAAAAIVAGVLVACATRMAILNKSEPSRFITFIVLIC